MVRPPRGSTRSAKYIVQVAEASESSGLWAHTMCTGTDNETLGQTSVLNTAVPTGAKIKVFDIRMPKVNLGAGTANFIHWTIQRTLTGQSVINPVGSGGSPLRTNIMLSGVIGLGAGQNDKMHIRFKVPPKYQRIADGTVWNVVGNNGGAVSAVYEFIYKVFT